MMSQAARPDAVADAIPMERRVELLANVAGFAPLAAPALRELALLCGEEQHAAGATVVREGDPGGELYLLASGAAEVSVKTPSGPAPIAVLRAGDLFGEIALLTPGAVRQATVSALDPLLCLTLAGGPFRELLEKHPEVAAIFHGAAGEMLKARFLKQATPFTHLPAERLRWLAGRLQTASVASGENIIRAGEPGDACYLLRAGKVEVVSSTADGMEKRLATLGAPACFGEAALLTEAPRNATVRALASCDLLVLRREDLLEAMGSEQQVAARILSLLPMRARPRRVAGVIAIERPSADGETFTILKNPERFTYFRLSAHGRFLWDRLDGRHSLRDLSLDYLEEFKAFAPQVIAEILGALTNAGFVEVTALRGDVLDKAVRLPWWQRTLLQATRILEWRKTIRNVDAPLTRLYEGGIRRLFTGWGQALLASVAIAGLGAFFAAYRAGSVMQPVPAGMLLSFLVPALLVSLVIHEAGHAFTTKAVGCEVMGMGVGWYWFGPAVFIDTSDVWRASRNQRIAVSIAGPYMNVIGGGLAALAAWFVPDGRAAAALWQVALLSYVMVLLCLNPLLEYDGYYVLMDWFERANLRSHALAWLGRELPKALRTGSGLGGHSLELLYGAGSVIYIVVMCICTAQAWRALVQPWVAHVLPGGVSAALAWAPGAALAALSMLSMADEMRKVR